MPGQQDHNFGRKETAWALLLPPLVTAVMALGVALLAVISFQPA